MKRLLATAACVLATAMTAGQAANAPAPVTTKKRILLVTTSVGFRHPSVPYAEKAIREMAAQSGQFEIVSTTDSPDFPVYPAPQPFETAGKPGAGPDRSAARGGGPPRVGGPPPGGAGLPGSRAGGTADATTEKVRKVLAQYISAEALKRYDAVFFVVTNGELPLPDPQAFLDWVKAGHGYLGSHSASDSLHGLPGYIEMLGGEFQRHGAQEWVKLENNDPSNPMTAGFTQGLEVHEEWYLFRPGYDRSKVHSLVSMMAHPNDKTAGHFPVSWCKNYGTGRVYYTSQGHRLDLWDANWIGTDGQRTNSKATVDAFRNSLLAAMRWTTRLIEANCAT